MYVICFRNKISRVSEYGFTNPSRQCWSLKNLIQIISKVKYFTVRPIAKWALKWPKRDLFREWSRFRRSPSRHLGPENFSIFLYFHNYLLNNYLYTFHIYTLNLFKETTVKTIRPSVRIAFKKNSSDFRNHQWERHRVLKIY